MKTIIAAFMATAFAIAGCGGPTNASPSESSAPSPTHTVPPAGEHYSSVAALKEAFVAAGGGCSTYAETNKVSLAAESAECGSATVLSIYSSVGDRDQVISGMKQFADVVGMTVLVGDNWIVNDKHVSGYQPKLGGTLVTREAKDK